MCDDNEECDGPAAMAKLLAQLHGPGIEKKLARFLGHMRVILPDFAAGVDDDVLLVVFMAGRTDALGYLRGYCDSMEDASNAMEAMALAGYSEKRGIVVEVLTANLEKFQQEHQKGATQ